MITIHQWVDYFTHIKPLNVLSYACSVCHAGAGGLCYSRHYLHPAFFRVSPNDKTKLVAQDPAALKYAHVPALDLQQLLLGVLLLLTSLAGIQVPELVKPSSYGSEASTNAFLRGTDSATACPAAAHWPDATVKAIMSVG
jgi:hypothetical protein